MKRQIVLSLMLVMMNVGLFAAQGDTNKSAKALSNNCGIQGIVIDADTQEALAGVQLEVEGMAITAHTDLEGRFVIVGLPQGDYNLKVSYISYKDSKVKNMAAQTQANLQAVQLRLQAE